MFKWVSSPPNGRSGGLLVGFNSDTFEVSDIQTKDFMIVCVVHHKIKNISWTFVNVYGAAQAENKPYVANIWSFLFNAIIDHHGLIELDLTDKKLRGPITEILPLLKNLTNF
jgi:hypothetical protein